MPLSKHTSEYNEIAEKSQKRDFARSKQHTDKQLRTNAFLSY